MQGVMALADLDAFDDLARQRGLLRRLQAVLLADGRCLGAAVGGSLASGQADHLSDVDLVVYCTQGSARCLLSTLSQSAADRSVTYRLDGQHDPSSVYEKVILEDWSSYEIHVIEPSTRMRLRKPYVEVIDRGSYLATRVSNDKPIGRETLRPYDAGDAGLIWELFNCIKWLRRGHSRPASEYLQSLGSALAMHSARET